MKECLLGDGTRVLLHEPVLDHEVNASAGTPEGWMDG